VRDHPADRRSQPTVTSEVTHIDPPRTWGRGIDGPVRATVDVTVKPLTEASSRLTIAVDFARHGIGRLLVPLIIRHQAHKEMPANVDALKRRVRPSSPSTRRRTKPRSPPRCQEATAAPPLPAAALVPAHSRPGQGRSVYVGRRLSPP
jgi:hypothetical protein